jgi:hypothetical protein
VKVSEEGEHAVGDFKGTLKWGEMAATLKRDDGGVGDVRESQFSLGVGVELGFFRAGEDQGGDLKDADVFRAVELATGGHPGGEGVGIHAENVFDGAVADGVEEGIFTGVVIDECRGVFATVYGVGGGGAEVTDVGLALVLGHGFGGGRGGREEDEAAEVCEAGSVVFGGAGEEHREFATHGVAGEEPGGVVVG